MGKAFSSICAKRQMNSTQNGHPSTSAALPGPGFGEAPSLAGEPRGPMKISVSRQANAEIRTLRADSLKTIPESLAVRRSISDFASGQRRGD